MTLRNKKNLKYLVIILVIVLILLAIPPVKEAVVSGVSRVLDIPDEVARKGVNILHASVAVGVGLFVLGAAVKMAVAAAVVTSLIGVVLVIAAVALTVWGLNKVFGWWGGDNELPPGQKPDNVSLGGAM